MVYYQNVFNLKPKDQRFSLGPAGNAVLTSNYNNQRKLL